LPYRVEEGFDCGLGLVVEPKHRLELLVVEGAMTDFEVERLAW
tara:strand:+ start:214 stop:342 length:129 start_codon:yes stop_codon:yes gene_type:complete